VHDSQASLERARELLGYRPTVALADGLRRTVAWFRETRA
jgi:nucleoside-diphosphate-sugar epimerase